MQENKKGDSGSRLFRTQCVRLLELDGGTGLFQLLLCVVGSILAHAGQHLAARGLSERLGLAQAQAGQLADDLNGFDLLRAGILDDDVEFGLFFNGFGSGGRKRSPSRRRAVYT